MLLISDPGSKSEKAGGRRRLGGGGQELSSNLLDTPDKGTIAGRLAQAIDGASGLIEGRKSRGVRSRILQHWNFKDAAEL